MLLSYPTFVEGKGKKRDFAYLLDVMKIQLPDFVIADLYRSSLVIADDIHTIDKVHQDNDSAAAPLEQEQEAAIVYLGDNDKGIAVVVNNPQHRFLDDESLQLLTNMLTALQLTMNDIALFNIHHMPFAYKDIKTQFGNNTYLLFGVATQQVSLPFQMPDYKVQTFDNCRFLCSASLEHMKGAGQAAKLEKTKLWMCLKTLFE